MKERKMAIVPAFRAGIWNAWLLVIPVIFASHALSYSIVNRKTGLFLRPKYRKHERVSVAGLMGTLIGLFAYSIFVPLKLESAWFYVGFLIYLVGVVYGFLAMLSFATTPPDGPAVKGIFRITRNPMSFGVFLIVLGIGIACASWVFLVLSVVSLILVNIVVRAEERICLEKYGDAYRTYMKRTPKWIGIPKSGKSDEAKSNES